MGDKMSLTDLLSKWSLAKGLQKAVRVAVQAGAAWYAAHSGLFDAWGVSLNIDQDTLAAALLGLSELFRNKLKHRWPKWFSWV